MEDAALDQHGGVVGSKPGEEVRHEAGDVREWRGHVYDVAEGVHDAHVDVPPLSGAGDEAGGHHGVGLEEVGKGEGVEGCDGGVGGVGPLDFGNLPGGGRNAFACEDGGDLVFGEGVAFDGGGAPEGTDVVGLAEAEAVRAFEKDAVAFDGGGDFGHHVHRLAADGVGRLVGGEETGGLFHGCFRKAPCGHFS